ncbi:hypothetical protein PN417_16915 [Halorubrum ezzemoulense]|uniref:hypothetical protein n=1 Tax=Halorubrum ezzemoulense TaxID=337243 RepID=UPI00232E1D71|nr:hypothetical protein [Halorubrum ezzemoulense]MDB9302594.1 hypothetical protein [Halorubrum ezzemoulense]
MQQADGTERCIGYGTDSEGNVTERFALTNGHTWEAPDATEAAEYVESMDELPPLGGDYQSNPNGRRVGDSKTHRSARASLDLF